LPLLRPVHLPESLEDFQHKNSSCRCEEGFSLTKPRSVLVDEEIASGCRPRNDSILFIKRPLDHILDRRVGDGDVVDGEFGQHS
jgi:hypothetical protein